MKRIAAVVLLCTFATVVIAQGSPKAINPELVNPWVAGPGNVNPPVINPGTPPDIFGNVAPPPGGSIAITAGNGAPFLTGFGIVGGAAVIGGIAAASGGSNSGSNPATAGTGGTAGTR